MDWLQWPAMAVTLGSAWLLAARSERKRNWGFWGMLASNALWSIWGWSAHAYALIALQAGLAATNVRGAIKTRRDS